MTRILHLIDTSGPGGAETVFLDLFKGFSGGDFASVPLVTEGSWVQAALHREGFTVHTCDPRGSVNVRYLREIVRLIRREHIGLIVAHLSGPALYAALAGILTRTPVVSVFHGTVDFRQGSRLQRAKAGIVNAGSSGIVAVSNHLMEHLKATTSLDARKMRVIYNGVDLARFQIQRPSHLHQELGVGKDAIIVGSLGNLREPKGYPYLIEAARLLKDSDPHIHFAIAGHGSGNLQSALEELVHRSGVRKTVHFLGFRADGVHFLSGCDIFLLPSTTEGFSISTIEAMACRLPVVVTRSGGPEEIVTHEVDGRLVTPASGEAIAEAVRDLARDPGLRERLGDRATCTVRERFSLQTMLSAYEHMFEELLGQGMRTRPAEERGD